MIIYMERQSVESLSEAEIKEIIEENTGSGKCAELEAIYRGKHAILNHQKKDTTAPNNKLVYNVPKQITNTLVGYLLGKPVVYSSQNEQYMAELQAVFDYNDEQDANSELAKQCSIGGDCFELLYMDEDAKIRFAKVHPDQGIMICETDLDAPLLFIRSIYSKDKNKNTIRKVEVWDKAACWYFRSVNNGSLILEDVREHYWQDVPVVYYRNNDERMGDFEDIISLVNAYNKAQSNSANFFEDNDDALLKITRMGDVTSQDVKDMKEKRAIILEDGGDIQWLIKEINDAALENYKERLQRDMLTCSGVPNLCDDNFGNNVSGVAISYKIWSMEQICAVKERKMKRGLQRRIELITNMLNLLGGNYDWREIDIQFRRNRPQNMLEIAQIVQMLADVLSKQSRLQLLPNVEDPQAELERLQAEQEEEMAAFGSGSGYDALAKALLKAGEADES